MKKVENLCTYLGALNMATARIRKARTANTHHAKQLLDDAEKYMKMAKRWLE